MGNSNKKSSRGKNVPNVTHIHGSQAVTLVYCICIKEYVYLYLYQIELNYL